eukprot:COSAG04_NODE_3335_length_2916_cov_382.607739_4_plen_64_part_00
MEEEELEELISRSEKQLAKARERGWSQNDRTGAGLPPAGPRARTPVSPSGTGEVRFNLILIRF